MPARRKRTPHRRSKAKPLPRWAVLLLGLGIGISLVILMQYVAGRLDSSDSGLRNLFSRTNIPDRKPAGRSAGVNSAAKPVRPTFDFYTILPEIETVLPEEKVHTKKRHRTPKPEPDIRYILQAASLANFTDADRLKAKLALNGLEAYIEKVTIENKGRYFRVRLGPFEQLHDLDTVNKKLAQLGIQAIRLKVKQTPET